MKTVFGITVGLIVVLAVFNLFAVFLSDWERPPVDAAQQGYRGLGLEAVSNPRLEQAKRARNQVPEPPYPLEPSDGPLASETYENVPVLGDLSQEQFDRLMISITEWISPEEGCAYCHNEENLADDSVYTKNVARRMLQMTWEVNSNWDSHVGETGVTCYTCHRGQPVPANVWSRAPDPAQTVGLGNRAEQNAPASSVALSSLPYDPFTPFLSGESEIRVASTVPLPAGNRRSIKQAEWTYGLMMHFSDSLGVNCTFCHNTRSFFDWDSSPPQRKTAWHGIRMVRGVNTDYMEPLAPSFPPNRLGPLGDVLKVNCATCHQAVNKPLYGANMLKDYPSLAASP